MTTTTSSLGVTSDASARKFASLVPVVIITSSASCPGWIPAMSARVASRPTPSAYPSFVFESSFGSRVISASVRASTPDSERSYLTLCSQTDCMRSISKRGNFIASHHPLSWARRLFRDALHGELRACLEGCHREGTGDQPDADRHHDDPYGARRRVRKRTGHDGRDPYAPAN